MTEENIAKQRIQRWIVIVGVAILCGKFTAFFLTNSLGIFTDAMESIVNVVAGLIGFFSLRWAAKPRDRAHPFGHGKIELISASIEGILIAIAGLYIMYEGAMRLFIPSEIQKLDFGIWVVAISGVVNYVMGWYSVRKGRKYGSMALIAGGRHLQSDTYSTIGLVVGLLLLYFTGWKWVDSALALVFGTIILTTGIVILRKTVANLLDKADDEMIRLMVEAVNNNREPEWIDIHNTKIIKYGSYLYIDCDLTLPWYYNIVQSHDACDRLKSRLEDEYHDKALVSIHSDPCRPIHCSHCALCACDHRSAAYTQQYQITLENIILSDEERGEHQN